MKTGFTSYSHRHVTDSRVAATVTEKINYLQQMTDGEGKESLSTLTASKMQDETACGRRKGKLKQTSKDFTHERSLQLLQ